MKKFTAARIGALFVSLLVLPSAAQASSAEQAFADGKAQLAEADFAGAMRSFSAAARADRTNREYIEYFSLTRQIVTLRQRLDKERDPERWETTARALHAFYVKHRIYSEALTVDQQIHKRLNSASSAKRLAETQLAMNRDAAAAEVLAALDASKHTPSTRALQGLALSRQGKDDEARKIADAIELSDDAGPGTVYSVARLQAAIGNGDAALALLKRCFEAIAPSRLDDFKNHAKQAPELASLATTAAFAEALNTKSKVAESECSGGSKCAGCPMRGNCAGSQDH